MLSETTIQIPLIKGIDTKTDSKVAPVGDLVALENGVFTSPGKIKKRPGGSTLVSGITTPTKAIVPFGSSLAIIDGDNHLQIKVGETLVDKGSIPSASCRPAAVARNTSQAQTSPDGAYHANTGREMFVWSENGQGRYRIIDGSTGVTLADGDIDAGLCIAPRVVSLGTGWLLLWIRYGVNGYGQVWHSNVVASTLVFSAPGLLSPYGPEVGKICCQRGCLDVHREPDDTVTVAIPLKSGSYIVPAVYTFSGATYQGAILPCSYTSTDIKALTARTFSGKSLVAWQDESDQIVLTEYDWTGATASDKGVQATVSNVHSMSMSGLTYTAPGNVTGNRHLVVLSQRPQDSSNNKILSLTINEVSGTYTIMHGGVETVASGLSLASALRNPVSGQYQFLASYESLEQSTYFLYTYNDEQALDGEIQLVARVLSGVAGGPPVYSSLPQIYTRLSDYGVACLEKTSLGSSPKSGLFALTSVDRLVIGEGLTVKSAAAANGLLLSLGDLLMHWDGSALVEHSFHLYPDSVRLPAITSSANSYQYCAVYVYSDWSGQVMRSAASTPVTMTTADPIDETHTVSIQIPGLTLTQKQGVRVEVYRTEKDGTTFYRLASLPNASGWLTYIDSTTDARLLGDTSLSPPTGLTAQTTLPYLSSPGFDQSTRVASGNIDDIHDYYYLLTVVNEYGETTPYATAGEIVGNMSATARYMHYLAWSPVTGATKYRIYSCQQEHLGGQPPDSAFGLEVELPASQTHVYFPMLGLFSGRPWYGIAPPTSNTTAPGTLSTGNKYYRVSTINEVGETLACAEVSVNNTGAAVDLEWQPVYGGTGYRVYGRDTGAEELMAELSGVDSTSWHDDGSITPDGALPAVNSTGSPRAIGNIALYTSGGVVDNMPPPPVAWLATGKGRVFIADAENGNRVCFSHEILTGQPVEFAPTYLSVQVDPTGGAIAAVQAMDEKLICFKASSIYAFAGQGPDRTGSNSDYQPQIIAGDCGCSSPGSCVLMPSGVMFQSSKGIMLLDRALGLGYIGAQVEAYNSESVNSGVLVATANHVRMATSSRVLVYDYHMGAWATFAISGVRSSCIFDGLWTYALSTSAVKETPGIYVDPGSTAISLKIKTTWINFAGVAGFTRARRLALLGSYLSAHLLRVKLYVTPSDNSAVAAQDETFTANSGELHRIPLTQQKFSALQVEIWDDFTGLSPGEGYDISALAFEVGLKPKLAKLSSSKTY